MLQDRTRLEFSFLGEKQYNYTPTIHWKETKSLFITKTYLLTL